MPGRRRLFAKKADLLYLPLAADETWAAPELPPEISDWLYNLTLLNGVPFNYLIPDERLLPTESLRFLSSIHCGWPACVMGRLALGGSWSKTQAPTAPITKSYLSWIV